MLKSVNMIVASTEDMGIGFKGNLPWKLRSELAYFAKMTKTTQDPEKKNAVIMGRKTWESIPVTFRPLKGRVNIVLSRKGINFGKESEDVFQCSSFEEALTTLSSPPFEKGVETIWIIGGASIYQEALERGLCDKIYWTWILNDFECDTFMPRWSSKYIDFKDPNVPGGEQEENGVKFKYYVFKRSDH